MNRTAGTGTPVLLMPLTGIATTIHNIAATVKPMQIL